MPIVEKEKAVLEQLALHLKERRLDRNDRQEDTAARLGISPRTYRKMENADPSISIGHWLTAIRLYGDLSLLDHVFAERKSLFDQRPDDKEKTKTVKRKRAARR